MLLAGCAAVTMLGSGCVGLLPPRVLYPKHVVYGQVVDDKGMPVPSVELSASWFAPSPFPFGAGVGHKQIQTDTNGHWDLAMRELIQTHVSVRLNCPAGYEYLSEHGTGATDLEHAQTTPDQRLILRLRKRGEGTFLLQGTSSSRVSPLAGGLMFRPPTDNRAIDILRRHEVFEIEHVKGTRASAEFRPDLDVSIRLPAETNACLFVFTVLSEGGVVLTDRQLFEAPETGYSRSAMLSVPEHTWRTYYAYVHSRDPPVYTRLTWSVQWGWGDMRTYPARGVQFKYNTVTNPYGERNLEEALDIPPTLRTRLEKEAREALAAGRLPEKPDLKKLVAETKKGAPR
jgi:hypothetical protein